MRRNILIYFPYNHRTVEQQSVMEILVNKGYSVFLLTLTSKNSLHTIAKELGVRVSSSPVNKTSGFKNIFLNAKYLVAFCRANCIQVIIAHQQVAALPVIFAKPFISCKIFYVRHNSDEDYKAHPVKAWIMNRFINRMLPRIIAPSRAVYQYMKEQENVLPKKLIRINYGYNFSQYEMPDLKKSREIRDAHQCELLLVSVARLVAPKRHALMFEVVRILIEKGMDIKLICLGNGPLKNQLQKLIESKLPGRVFLRGIQQNIFDYLAAGDVFLHLSETEASNSAVKEAGLVKKTVVVCKKVGDFEDYIVHEKNGFLVKKEDPLQQSVRFLEKCYNNREILPIMGNNLCETVLKKFDINNVSSQYDDLINNASSNQ
jgi:glycosyltransferase involved in cell wall biosynthesis